MGTPIGPSRPTSAPPKGTLTEPSVPLESATYISQLVATNPITTDEISQGDDHLRLVKSVLQTQFPNLGAAAVTGTAT